MTIDIRIDEDACVGCSLCTEVCPTKVFDFNESKMVPEVKKPAECFGCLSCSEICPATALQHGNVLLSQSYYHDPAALKLAGLLGQPPRFFNTPTGDDVALKSAEADLGIRLLSVAAVLRQTLGQSLAAIGTQAGRSLAAQLPRYQPPASLDEALKLTQETFAPAWDFQFERKDTLLTLKVKSCFIRELCRKDNVPTGGDLCVLFYGYLAGYLSKIAAVRPRLVETKRGESECGYSIQIHAAAGG
jgi:NAD-dependent dihydropyrimidine dehydrogenase PreA subunit